MNSLVEENYLKAIFTLSHSTGDVTVNDVAKYLKITMPTVTSMMKKLAAKKYIQYISYKPVRLTVKGKKVAALIIRKHRLTEMFLSRVMGFGWEEVHDIAEQIEHINHPGFFNKMDAMLGFPVVDPHGSAIPDKHGNIAEQHSVPLSTVEIQKKCVVRAVINGTAELLSYLTKTGINLGTILTTVEREEFDGMLTVETMQPQSSKKTILVLSKRVCEHLSVEILS